MFITRTALLTALRGDQRSRCLSLSLTSQQRHEDQTRMSKWLGEATPEDNHHNVVQVHRSPSGNRLILNRSIPGTGREPCMIRYPCCLFDTEWHFHFMFTFTPASKYGQSRSQWAKFDWDVVVPRDMRHVARCATSSLARKVEDWKLSFSRFLQKSHFLPIFGPWKQHIHARTGILVRNKGPFVPFSKPCASTWLWVHSDCA